jgi:hypothetical protein
MEEEKICSECQKNPATRTCTDCGVPLCDECMRKIKLQTGARADQMAGYGMTSGVQLSGLRPGHVTKYLCKKCYKNVDVEMD